MRPRAILLLLFPVALWVISTFAYAGNIGEWNDDYALNQRDPATGRLQTPISPMKPGFFWRPIYWVVAPGLATGLAGNLWISHLISAATHGLVCFLIYRLVRALGLSRHAAMAGALLFMVYPVAWEVPLWNAAIGTGLGTALFLALCLLAVRHARLPEAGAAPGATALTVTGMVLLAAIIPCLNEQPATGIPAVPLLYLAAAPVGTPLFRTLRRAIGATFLCGLCLIAYIALYYFTAPQGVVRGSAGTYVATFEALKTKLADLRYNLDRFFLMRQFGRGAIVYGIRTASRFPRAASITAAALLLTGAPWLNFWVRTQARPALGGPRFDPRPQVLLIAFGLACFALAWLPSVLILNQYVEPRVCYPPALGLAFALAGAADLIAGVVGRWRIPARGLAVATAAALALALPAGAVAMFGVQSALRYRWIQDLSEVRQLAALVPHPEPHSVFVPLDSRLAAPATGEWFFDHDIRGAFEILWVGPRLLHRTYARDDIECAWWYYAWPLPTLATGAESRGLRYDEHIITVPWDKLPGKYDTDDSGAKLLPWGRIIPFYINAAGRVVLVDHFADIALDGTRQIFEAPQARQGADHAKKGATATFTHGEDGRLTFEITPGPPQPWPVSEKVPTPPLPEADPG